MKFQTLSTLLFAASVSAQAAHSEYSSPDFFLAVRNWDLACHNADYIGYLVASPELVQPVAAITTNDSNEASVGYLTFLPDAHSSSLVFPFSAGSTSFYGFEVNETASTAKIELPVQSYGIQGVYADDRHLLQVLSDVPISFYACRGYVGSDYVYTMFSKQAAAATPAGCHNVQLEVTYIDTRYQFPVDWTCDGPKNSG